MLRTFGNNVKQLRITFCAKLLTRLSWGKSYRALCVCLHNSYWFFFFFSKNITKKFVYFIRYLHLSKLPRSVYFFAVHNRLNYSLICSEVTHINHFTSIKVWRNILWAYNEEEFCIHLDHFWNKNASFEIHTCK